MEKLKQTEKKRCNISTQPDAILIFSGDLSLLVISQKIYWRFLKTSVTNEEILIEMKRRPNGKINF